LGESSPYELVYLAPAHLRQGQLLEQTSPALAADHYARCAQLWKNCDTALRGIVADAERRAGAVRGSRSGDERQ
jgi:hypothetical protein